jgi:hypothetical protein
MSALAKPLNHFSGATGSGLTTFVPAELVKAVEKQDVPALNGVAASYWLNFYVVGQIEPIKVKFAAAAARNTSYTNFVTANSAVIA